MPEPEQGTPEWWLKRLHAELAARKPLIQKFSRYYDGEHRLSFATTKFREAFGNLFAAFADNWCDLVVDATEERLDVEGFRIPTDATDAPASDELVTGDRDAWEIWQENALDAGSQVVHTEALINGCSYALVWPENGGNPLITPESPEQMIVAYQPGTRIRAAALKEWWDDWTGYVNATLYLPDGVYKFQSKRKVKNESDLGQAPNIRWDRREVSSEAWPLPNPLKVVPVVAFENRPRLLHTGVSEIAKVIPEQDAVNKLCADMMVAAEYQAYRQRVMIGMEVPVDPVTGQRLEDTFKHAVDRLWFMPNPDGKASVFEFDTVELSNFVGAIEMFIQHIASQTRTPPHYFYLKGQFPSGESIKSAETGLVAKSRRKMRHFGESWEEVLRLAFMAKRDSRADVMNSETIWGDPESRSESEHVDATLKKQALGVPQEQLWEDLGYTPQQIERFKAMREQEAAVAAKYPPKLAVVAGVGASGQTQAGGEYGGQ